MKKKCLQIMAEISQKFLDQETSIFRILLMYNNQIDQLLKTHAPGFSAISVLAIGGYGRKDRVLFSDLDLLFLAPNETLVKDEKLIHFIHDLQQLPFKIGYSVHTIDSIFNQSNQDLNLLTAILDARFLLGNRNLYQSFKAKVDSKENLPSIQSFIQAKYKEQLTRDRAYPINQQPDLKNTIGNLRYLQSIRWILIYIHPNASIHYLLDKDYITKDELHALRSAYKLLSTIRFYLHIHHKYEQNILALDTQLSIATFFSFEHKKPNKAIELFMQTYYNSCRHTKLINRLIFGELLSFYSTKKLTPLDHDWSICNGILQHQSSLFPQKTSDLLVTFQHFCTHEIIHYISSDLLRNIMQLVKKMNKKTLLRHTKLQQDFITLFTPSRNLQRALSMMMDIGLIEKIIPEFSRSKGQIQLDLYHRYTVDRHTIEVIHHLSEIRKNTYEESFPLAYQLMQQHPEPKLLYIAALFHDIGKGTGVDHSRFGARLVQKYGQIWQLKQDDIHLITWLVRHHLDFSHTIKKQDIFDGEVVRQFSVLCQSHYYLNSLFLLTIADIKGTNPTLWTNWQQTMFSSFHENICKQFAISSKLTLKERVRKTQKMLLAFCTKSHAEQIQTIWSTLPARYFIEQGMPALEWQTAQLQKINLQTGSAQFFSHLSTRANQSMVMILAPNNSFAISSICHCLHKADINIADASFFKLPDKKMLYYFIITDNTSQPLLTDTLKWLITHLKTQLLIKQTKCHGSQSMAHKLNNVKRIKPSIQILSPQNKAYSKIIVKCRDRSGLLALLCYFLEQHNIRIIRAQIHTAAHKIEDTFYVLDNRNKPLNSQRTKQLLIHRFLKYLNTL